MDLELQSDLSDFRSGAFARVVRSLVEPSSRFHRDMHHSGKCTTFKTKIL